MVQQSAPSSAGTSTATRLLSFIRKILGALRLRSGSISYTQVLGSGVTVTDAERAEDNRKAYMDEQPKRLQRICESVVKDPKLLGVGPITHCNEAVYRICRQFSGYEGFYDNKRQDIIMANEMFDLMDAGGDWSKCDGKWANEFACSGGLAIAAQKEDGHGHVAVVAPMLMEKSPSWNKLVPVLANVGRTNGFLPASKCFKLEPTYFVLKQKKEA